LIEDSARLQRFRKAWNRLVLRLKVVEQFHGYLDLVGSRPFQQLGPIKTVLARDMVSRETSLSDPPGHRGLRHIQEPTDIPNGQLHCVLL
jgi:hypothetical protein